MNSALVASCAGSRGWWRRRPARPDHGRAGVLLRRRDARTASETVAPPSPELRNKARGYRSASSDRVDKRGLIRADCAVIQEGLLTNLGLALPARPVLLMQFHETHRAFDRLLLRLQFKHSVPTEDFLSLGEGPIGHGNLSS